MGTRRHRHNQLEVELVDIIANSLQVDLKNTESLPPAVTICMPVVYLQSAYGYRK